MSFIFSRLEMLIGNEGIEKLDNSHVIVFGVGGVGSYVVESFARSGIGNITMVDFDEISESNVNRQIHATTKTIGKLKAEVMKKRILEINSSCNVKIFTDMIFDNVEDFFRSKYDFVVDAIDMIYCKINLIEYCYHNKIPIVSSMGFGNKMHPELIEISDIHKTNTCPIARTIRRVLKSKKINKMTVVYSRELPIKPNKLDNEFAEEKLKDTKLINKVTPGSNVFVTGTAGFIISSFVVRKLIEI